MAELIDDGHLCIAADLTECDYPDSTGLGALVAAVKRLRARDGEIRIVTTSGHVRQVFEITSLDRIFPLFTTLEEAVG
jgi:anti-sigma B factor antagonist